MLTASTVTREMAGCDMSAVLLYYISVRFSLTSFIHKSNAYCFTSKVLKRSIKRRPNTSEPHANLHTRRKSLTWGVWQQMMLGIFNANSECWSCSEERRKAATSSTCWVGGWWSIGASSSSPEATRPLSVWSGLDLTEGERAPAIKKKGEKSALPIDAWRHRWWVGLEEPYSTKADAGKNPTWMAFWADTHRTL